MVPRNEYQVVSYLGEDLTSEVITIPTLYYCTTLFPSSCAIARAMAVLPVPGGPASSRARPAIFLLLIISTTIPAA